LREGIVVVAENERLKRGFWETIKPRFLVERERGDRERG